MGYACLRVSKDLLILTEVWVKEKLGHGPSICGHITLTIQPVDKNESTQPQ